MTRRERLQARMERREEWGEKARAKSAAHFKAADKATEGIPFGQPILVGHHSEKRHRAALDRQDSAMRNGIERADMAKEHTYKAAGIADALERSVFSDDPDAIDQLEKRIEELEAKRAHMVLVNKLYRKGDVNGLRALGLDLDKLRAQVAAVGMSFVKAPFEGYQLSNLGNRIRADRERIKLIEKRAAATARAEQAGGMIIERFQESCSVRFAEKPARDILDALRSATFFYSGGAWHGPIAKLPACVLELEGGGA